MEASSLVKQVLPCEELGIRTNTDEPIQPGSDPSRISNCLGHLARIAELKQVQRQNELEKLRHTHAQSLVTYISEYSTDLDECSQRLSAMVAHKSFVARRLQERLTRKDYIPIHQQQKRTFVKLVNEAKDFVESESGWRQRLQSAQQVLAKTAREDMEAKLAETQAAHAGVEQGFLLCEKLEGLRSRLVERSPMMEKDSEGDDAKENFGGNENCRGSGILWKMPDIS